MPAAKKETATTTASKATTLHEKHVEIQAILKAPKNLYNSFGGYWYRDAEGILEAVKPLCHERGLSISGTTRVEAHNNKNYIVHTAILSDGKDTIEEDGVAREDEDRKKTDGPQLSGSATSYAKKYALSAMFAIDDTKDADFENNAERNAEAPATASTPVAEEVIEEERNPLISLLAVEEIIAFMSTNSFIQEQKDEFKAWLAENNFTLGGVNEQGQRGGWNVREDQLESVMTKLSEIAEPF